MKTFNNNINNIKDKYIIGHKLAPNESTAQLSENFHNMFCDMLRYLKTLNDNEANKYQNAINTMINKNNNLINEVFKKHIKVANDMKKFIIKKNNKLKKFQKYKAEDYENEN